ncbi:general stress protein [Sporosarcina trichiuri]|uniref:general stress protein n=1 Tax=Sporosarcina trichiuri TaxID=3056445 RepID=UPI0025B54723|nr:general stress protein [Sporosarcina sp. 0.2-SM1T-5]WJY26203.1 general stress protein [Sporosarcina sp. 0.2-SM1T-5]
MNREFAGIFESETELLEKINELHRMGIAEENMYVVTKDKEDVSIVRGRTDAEIQETEASWWDRFTSFLSDEQPARKALHRMDLTEDEADRYIAAVENGSFLLYVDKGDFWDMADHDAGNLTEDIGKRMDTGEILPEQNDAAEQEKFLDDARVEHQNAKYKL